MTQKRDETWNILKLLYNEVLMSKFNTDSNAER